VLTDGRPNLLNASAVQEQTSNSVTEYNITRLLRILDALYDITRDCEMCTDKVDAILRSERLRGVEDNIEINTMAEEATLGLERRCTQRHKHSNQQAL
jgi:hypothetical protein